MTIHTRSSWLRPITLALTLATLGAVAQAQTPTQTPATPQVDQRQANQAQRIDQGVASGELNRREAHRLQHQQGRIQRAENRAKADGTVTAGERKHLHHMQDRASRNIAHQKHDRQHRKHGQGGAKSLSN
jgi:hypothetical protein